MEESDPAAEKSELNAKLECLYCAQADVIFLSGVAVDPLQRFLASKVCAERLQSGALGSGDKDTEMAEPGNIAKPKNEKLVPEAVALSAKVAVQCKQVFDLAVLRKPL